MVSACMNTAVYESNRSVEQVREELEQQLTVAGRTSPRIQAEWLLADVLRCPRLTLYTRREEPVSDQQYRQVRMNVNRVAAGEPLQYVTGCTDFMEVEVQCDQRALIPRPETEGLVQRVLDNPALQQLAEPDVVDVGTGTGCIALALAKAWGHARVLAVDVEEAALNCARENVARLGLAERIRCRSGDLLQGAPARSADVVVANLPYIASDEWPDLPAEVRDVEPRTALDGGRDGLDLIRRLVQQARGVLRPAGWLYLEIGASQGAMVRSMLRQSGYQRIVLSQDWAQRDRIMEGECPQ